MGNQRRPQSTLATTRMTVWSARVGGRAQSFVDNGAGLASAKEPQRKTLATVPGARHAAAPGLKCCQQADDGVAAVIGILPTVLAGHISRRGEASHVARIDCLQLLFSAWRWPSFRHKPGGWASGQDTHSQQSTQLIGRAKHKAHPGARFAPGA